MLGNFNIFDISIGCSPTNRSVMLDITA